MGNHIVDENIQNAIAEKMGVRLAKEIDDYALSVFKIPKWLLKRKLLPNTSFFEAI